jgi:uncharacterized RDD family membrane protein YckC
MSAGSLPSEPDRGYLSVESKRRFTLVAGVLGTLFFLAQFLLPMLFVFLVMMPAMFLRDLKTVELDEAALWRGELWVVERSVRLNWRNPQSSTRTLGLARVRLADLSDAGPALPLEGFSETTLALLTIGDRLWVIGSDSVAYYQGGSLTRLPAKRPPRASRPFGHAGQPAVVSLGTRPALATLRFDGTRAEWTSQELPLDLPAEAGGLRALQAVEAGGSLYLFAQLCIEALEYCSLKYRELAGQQWLPLIENVSSRADWTALTVASRPAVVLSEQEREGRRTEVVTVGATGPQRVDVEAATSQQAGIQWQPFSSERGLVLASSSMPGSLRILEVANGRVTRTARKPGSFPFGPHMMLLMMIPQLLPILLSLVLALLLTLQMRRHRVPDYVVGEERRTFASLWQRSLAQLVDLVPFVAGFATPGLWMWRMFSDPERFLEEGAAFPWLFFALFFASFLWALLVLVAFSYLEGRFGKTPGKWLLGIRVVGMDLRPCGFWRALVRNLLTLADGFFSFLVGALLVALTENWQRLGDLAARTIVVVDRRSARGSPSSVFPRP